MRELWSLLGEDDRRHRAVSWHLLQFKCFMAQNWHTILQRDLNWTPYHTGKADWGEQEGDVSLKQKETERALHNKGGTRDPIYARLFFLSDDLLTSGK